LFGFFSFVLWNILAEFGVHTKIFGIIILILI